MRYIIQLSIKHHNYILLIIALALIVAACSTEKNTSQSRWWQSFNTRYNVYYNGSVAYIDGSLEKENGNQDNFTEMIPLYTVGNKASRELGKSQLDKAIEKMEKAIRLHSIKRKPEWNKNRRKTERDIEWLSRKEYNPFLWKAWMLMGRAQFYEGDFDAAASTFSYMSRLYQTQPAIYARARAWLAKSYIENNFLYDAEDVIRNVQRDSINRYAQKEWDYTYADYYIHSGDYAKAIPYMHKVIRHEMRRKQKAREYYLLGQLYEIVGRQQEAYKAFGKAIKMNPPYQLEFNARIAQTGVMATGQAKKMIGKLKRLAASDKNTEYLDQIYYAIGNIYLAEKDTTKAITSYETGNTRSTRGGIEKGVLLLKLGNLYWDTEKFADAQRCYGEAIGLLDKDRKDYEQLSNRSKVLDELVPYTEAVHLQDSLQNLARMDEHDRNAAIDRVIAALKKKEKAEKRLQDEQNAAQAIQQNAAQTGSTIPRPQSKAPVPRSSKQNNEQWYFYNPMAVMQGKQQFERLWGKRQNVDDWQRNNKTVVSALPGREEAITDRQRDSIQTAQAREDSIRQRTDSAQNDPHRREYYLAQIPFTPEQQKASDAIIMDGLFHSGVIFKDKLDNLPLSEKALRRLDDNYPTYEHADDLYYHLFLLYSRMGDTQRAQAYVDKLKAKYPQSQWTALLTDPHFIENARTGVHLEDSLYTATYKAFKADRFTEVSTNAALSRTRFPQGANRDKFIFINGLSKLNSGDAQACLDDMQTLVKDFPQSKLSEMAGMIINGVREGRRLRGGKFDIGDVWSRRSVTLSDSTATRQKKLSNERNTGFTFMWVYNPDSINENKLLFQVARYNFMSYPVRSFDINIEEADGVHRMQIAGFRNYDEALQYARQLVKQRAIATLVKRARPVIISQENLPLLGTAYSYDEYDKFYSKHFAPLKVSTFRLLTEPDEIVTQPATKKDEQTTERDIDNYLDDTFITNDEPAVPAGTVVPNDTDNTTNKPTENTTVIPTDNQNDTTPQGTTIEIPAEIPPLKGKPEGTIIAPEPPARPVTPKPIDVPRPKITTPAPKPAPVQPQPQAPEPEQPTISNGVDIIFDDIPDAPGHNTKPAAGKGTTVKTTPPATGRQPATTGKPAGPDTKTGKGTPAKTGAKTTKPTPAKAGEDKKNNQKTEKKSAPKTFDLEDEYYDFDGF